MLVIVPREFQHSLVIGVESALEAVHNPLGPSPQPIQHDRTADGTTEDRKANRCCKDSVPWRQIPIAEPTGVERPADDEPPQHAHESRVG